MRCKKGDVVQLDLNGHVLDRGLSDAEMPAKDDKGSVICIKSGALKIIDSSPDTPHKGYIQDYVWHWDDDAAGPNVVEYNGGVITGGFSENGGGIVFNGRAGQSELIKLKYEYFLEIEKANIVGNKAGLGAGIAAPKINISHVNIEYNYAQGGTGIAQDTAYSISNDAVIKDTNIRHNISASIINSRYTGAAAGVLFVDSLDLEDVNITDNTCLVEDTKTTIQSVAFVIYAREGVYLAGKVIIDENYLQLPNGIKFKESNFLAIPFSETGGAQNGFFGVRDGNTIDSDSKIRVEIASAKGAGSDIAQKTPSGDSELSGGGEISPHGTDDETLIGESHIKAVKPNATDYHDIFVLENEGDELIYDEETQEVILERPWCIIQRIVQDKDYSMLGTPSLECTISADSHGNPSKIIKLLRNISCPAITNGILISSDSSIAIDLNGHVLDKGAINDIDDMNKGLAYAISFRAGARVSIIDTSYHTNAHILNKLSDKDWSWSADREIDGAFDTTIVYGGLITGADERYYDDDDIMGTIYTRNANGATISLNNITIAGNRTSGIVVDAGTPMNSTTFTNMSNTNLSYNTTAYVGGAYILTQTSDINDLRVTNNIVSCDGEEETRAGGAAIITPTARISDLYVRNNMVLLSEKSTDYIKSGGGFGVIGNHTLSGTIKVQDNYLKELNGNKIKSNLCVVGKEAGLGMGGTIDFDNSVLSTNSYIGLSTMPSLDVIRQDKIDVSTETIIANWHFFHSDNPQYYVNYNSNKKIELSKVPSGYHSINLELSGNGDGTIQIGGNQVAQEGEERIFAVFPDEGSRIELPILVLNEQDGSIVRQYDELSADGKYYFTMPNHNVKIFAKIGTVEESGGDDLSPWGMLSATMSSQNSKSTEYFTVNDVEHGIEGYPTRNIKLLKDISATADDISLLVNTGMGGIINLDLNGHVLDRNLTDAKEIPSKADGSVIFVRNGGLVLTDSNQETTHKGIINENRIWDWDETDSVSGPNVVEIKGGVITGGLAEAGGGIAAVSGGVLAENVNIVGNTALYGGGIFSDVFRISNSNIMYNTAIQCAGIGAKTRETGFKNISNTEIKHNIARSTILGKDASDLDEDIIATSHKLLAASTLLSIGGIELNNVEISDNVCLIDEADKTLIQPAAVFVGGTADVPTLLGKIIIKDNYTELPNGTKFKESNSSLAQSFIGSGRRRFAYHIKESFSKDSSIGVNVSLNFDTYDKYYYPAIVAHTSSDCSECFSLDDGEEDILFIEEEKGIYISYAWAYLQHCMLETDEYMALSSSALEVVDETDSSGNEVRNIKLLKNITCPVGGGRLDDYSNKIIKLDLNGHVLDRGGYKSETFDRSGVIGSYSSRPINFILTDTSDHSKAENKHVINENDNNEWTWNDDKAIGESQHIVQGGLITGATQCSGDSDDCGAIYIDNGNAFIDINNVTIAGNTCKGIESLVRGFMSGPNNFAIKNTDVCYNTAVDIGGCVFNNKNTEINNLKIYNNTVVPKAGDQGNIYDAYAGGGVTFSNVTKINNLSVYDNNVYLNQNQSTQNAGGGFGAYGEVELSGKIIIKDNYYKVPNKEKTMSDFIAIQLPSTPGLDLHFSDTGLLNGSNIAITALGLSVPRAGHPVPFSASCDSNYSKYFHSDVPDYYVNYNADKCLELTTTPSGYYAIVQDLSGDGEGSLEFPDGQIAQNGDKVTFYPIPGDGYKIDSIAAKSLDGKIILSVDKNDDGSYTFTMPDQHVRVTAEFVPGESETDDGLSPWGSLSARMSSKISSSTDYFEVEDTEVSGKPVRKIKLLNDIVASADDVSLKVDCKKKLNGGSIELDLNGHVLDRKLTDSTEIVSSDGSVIIVNSGRLKIIDSNPNAVHKGTINNMRIWDWDDSTSDPKAVEIKGGIITGGLAELGGGIYADTELIPDEGENILTIDGGTIAGNTAIGGGGVFSNYYDINNANISYNVACVFGAIGQQISNISKLSNTNIKHNIVRQSIYNKTIKNASKGLEGIVSRQGTSAFVFYPGMMVNNCEITDNTCLVQNAAIDFKQSAVFISVGKQPEYISGKIIIKDNFVELPNGIKFKELNALVYASNTKPFKGGFGAASPEGLFEITNGETLSEESKIGFSTNVETTNYTPDNCIIGKCDTDYSKCFFADNPGDLFTYNKGLKTISIEHPWQLLQQHMFDYEDIPETEAFTVENTKNASGESVKKIKLLENISCPVDGLALRASSDSIIELDLNGKVLDRFAPIVGFESGVKSYLKAASLAMDTNGQKLIVTDTSNRSNELNKHTIYEISKNEWAWCDDRTIDAQKYEIKGGLITGSDRRASGKTIRIGAVALDEDLSNYALNVRNITIAGNICTGISNFRDTLTEGSIGLTNVDICYNNSFDVGALYNFSTKAEINKLNIYNNVVMVNDSSFLHAGGMLLATVNGKVSDINVHDNIVQVSNNPSDLLQSGGGLGTTGQIELSGKVVANDNYLEKPDGTKIPSNYITIKSTVDTIIKFTKDGLSKDSNIGYGVVPKLKMLGDPYVFSASCDSDYSDCFHPDITADADGTKYYINYNKDKCLELSTKKANYHSVGSGSEISGNGTVEIKPDGMVEEGTTITIKPTPDEGYVVGSITVESEDGTQTVPVRDNGDGTYSFEMPDFHIKISVDFVPDESETDDGLSPWGALSARMRCDKSKSTDYFTVVDTSADGKPVRKIQLLKDLIASADDTCLIADCSGKFSGGIIELDLNGHVLDRGLIDSDEIPKEYEGSVIVLDVGTLRIIDSNSNAVHKGTVNKNGVWDWDEKESVSGANVVEIKGGIITGGLSGVGGGIFANNLTMVGGNVVGNTALAGGGINSDKYSIDSTNISYNNAVHCGGILQQTYSKSTLTNVKINHNTVRQNILGRDLTGLKLETIAEHGCSALTISDNVKVNGCEIMHNTCISDDTKVDVLETAVFCESKVPIDISGKMTICENFVELPSGNKLDEVNTMIFKNYDDKESKAENSFDIDGSNPITKDSRIGITINANTFTTSYLIAKSTTDLSNCFYSDNGDDAITYLQDKKAIKVEYAWQTLQLHLLDLDNAESSAFTVQQDDGVKKIKLLKNISCPALGKNLSIKSNYAIEIDLNGNVIDRRSLCMPEELGGVTNYSDVCGFYIGEGNQKLKIIDTSDHSKAENQHKIENSIGKEWIWYNDRSNKGPKENTIKGGLITGTDERGSNSKNPIGAIYCATDTDAELEFDNINIAGNHSSGISNLSNFRGIDVSTVKISNSNICYNLSDKIGGICNYAKYTEINNLDIGNNYVSSDGSSDLRAGGAALASETGKISALYVHDNRVSVTGDRDLYESGAGIGIAGEFELSGKIVADQNFIIDKKRNNIPSNFIFVDMTDMLLYKPSIKFTDKGLSTESNIGVSVAPDLDLMSIDTFVFSASCDSDYSDYFHPDITEYPDGAKYYVNYNKDKCLELSKVKANYHSIDSNFDISGNGKIEDLPSGMTKEGETITIRPVPDEGYKVDSIIIRSTDGEHTVKVTDNGDGTYSFVMPDFNIEIVANFVPDGSQKDPVNPPVNPGKNTGESDIDEDKDKDKDDKSTTFEKTYNLLVKVKANKNRTISLEWNKVKGVEYYEVYLSAINKKMKVRRVTAKNNCELKKNGGKLLKPHKMYKVKVVAHLSDGSKLASRRMVVIAGNTTKKFGNIRRVRAVEKFVKLSVGNTKYNRVKYKVYKNKKRLPKRYGRLFRYGTSNPDVVTVDKYGWIQAVGKGTAKIFTKSLTGPYCITIVTVE